MHKTTETFIDLLKREDAVLRQAEQPSKTERRLIAEKAFMLGVDWLLKKLTQHQDIWNVDDEDAKVLRMAAEKAITQYVGK